ncbi:MAG: hypothetical protein COB60_11750 [Flavobacteriaceae bacterium]|nr:MAG: hypothetical protein COB60_11750 [Flavobacteriaceae bacterium]
MPIKSYILHPLDGEKQLLIKELSQFPECEITPAENHEIIVLVTDTDSEIADTNLFNKLNELKSLKHMSLVSGFEDK